MYIQLEEKDHYTIANEIVGSEKDRGTEYVDIDGLEFEISFSKEVNGYTENDYHNGTGAFVCTDAVVELKDITCGDVKVFFNNGHIECLAERMLKD